MSEELTISTPPGRTDGANFSSDGRFMTTASLGREMMGEPMGLSATTTVQLAVPPRISGP